MQGQEPAVVRLDPRCLHSALKEFFDPLRTNDSRADFFAVYRKEADEFDREYTRKYDEDLNTSLIFAGLFSAVSSAFIIDVQSKLEPDPNETTAAYMQVLIHAVNGTLFPDADPNAVTWAGPPPGVVVVQSLLYASLATSLFASFLAMLGKQWINRYLRNRGGSAVDKSRNRQRKLDGLEGWRFYLVIEALPVMLQLALLLFGCALSRYLWTISLTVAGFVLAFTLFGVASYAFFTLTATLYYNCPYQTPPSILIRILTRSVSRSESTFARSLRSRTAYLAGIYSHSTRNLRRTLRRLQSGARGVVNGFSHTAVSLQETHEIPLAVVATPVRVFEDIRFDWDGFKADTRCIAWVLYSTTDSDMIYSTVRFAADTIWYPEIAQALSPHILAELFFECLLDGRVVPDKLEHASSIGMALVSVLGIQLVVEPEDEDLKGLCARIDYNVQWASSSEPVFALVVTVLKSIVQLPSPVPTGRFLGWWTSETTPKRLSNAHKLWLSRVILQMLWRWRRVQDPATVLCFYPMESVCRRLLADNDQSPAVLETNCILIMTISLGLDVDIHDLYVPGDSNALETVVGLLDQRLRMAIREGTADSQVFCSILSALSRFDPSRVAAIRELCFSWITDILSSSYTTEERYRMAGKVVELAWKHIRPGISQPFHDMQPAWVLPLLGFLQLSEECCSAESPSPPGSFALQILSSSSGHDDFGPRILPILTPMLLPTHPLRSRGPALKVFQQFISGWFSSSMEGIQNKDRARLLQAVGDPFQSIPVPPPQDEQYMVTNEDEPMKVAVILIEFASSGLWRDHLCRSNFTSCEEIVSTNEGKKSALGYMLGDTIGSWPQFLRTPTKILAAIERLERLQCFNIAEVVVMWAWTVGIVDTADHDSWKLIEHKTLAFYRAQGTKHLNTLSRHIIDATMKTAHYNFFRTRRRDLRHRVEGVRPPVRITEVAQWLDSGEGYFSDLPLAQVCQLRRLHQLFGHVTTTWGVVAAEKVHEGADMLVGWSSEPMWFMDWSCDYP